MFISEAKSGVKISVIEDDVAMGMGLVCVDCKHILIVALQETVAQFLSDLQGLFGCHFIRSETLDYVVCEDFGAPCSACSDCSEVGGSSSAVGSAGIRLHI